MRTEILQPWITIQGNAASVTEIIQDENDWIDLSDCADAVFWVEVQSVSPTTGVDLVLESSPTKDEDFFLPVAGIAVLTASPTPVILKSIAGSGAGGSLVLNPIARWVRWVLATSASSGTWSVTFRIRVSRARTPFFSPVSVPGCTLWLRSDTATVNSSGDVSAWDDITGNSGNTLSPTGSFVPFVAGQFNGFPGIQVDSNSGGYLATASGATIGPSSSLIVVIASAGSATNTQTIVGGPSNAAYLAQTANSSTSVTLNDGTAQPVTVGTSLAIPNILQVDWASLSQVYQNGIAQGSPVSAGTNSMTFATLGESVVSGNAFAGYFAEALAFSPALTPAWRTLVTRYLGNRYGIAVP